MNFKNQTVTIDDQSEPGSWAKFIGEAAMTNINSILEERGSSYGDFGSQALISQNIKAAMRHSPNWQKLPADMKESLEMVALKIGRILNGNPTYADSWIDIVGYTQLVVDRLERGQNAAGHVDQPHQTENGN